MAASEADHAVAAKKRKLEEGDTIECLQSPLKSFKGFSLEKVLCENAKSKSLFVLGQFEGSDDKAVVLLEKMPFSSERATHYVCSDTSLKETLKNDIYGTYDAFIPVQENAVKATVIYPATEKHITKYTDQERFVVTETAELYKNITLPYLEEKEFSVQWVYNILEKKKESERIVFEDPDPETGFILLPDMKWDRKNINTLYLQAIVHKHGIKSLRDLNGTHLPLLRNILENGSAAIKEKFDVPRSKLNIFFHYLPSYNHLHVHFMHVNNETHGFSHLLTDVIQNIELKEDYYQWKTLTYAIREMDELYKRFKEADHL
ncbi:hypothetical protein ACJMK2_016466 [Sinanodonta woodiana]|uniref:m7GpppX diphosphatase n=1 Tax=Sinanodonta woodiana TaxID=1069815 RepID=A0ABD3UTP4_SINWO